MKERRIVTDSLQDMLDNAEKATQFVEGVEFEAFRDNEEKSYAVVRALEVIGEGKVSPGSVDKHHQYAGQDYE